MSDAETERLLLVGERQDVGAEDLAVDLDLDPGFLQCLAGVDRNRDLGLATDVSL